MANLPISVPAYWPDLVVTSYQRETGSHSGGLALDLALDMPGASRAKGSKYWFFYFITLYQMWLIQRSGIVRAAVPPVCPHFHLEINQKPFIGLENIRYDSKTKNCVYQNHIQVSKTDTAISNDFIDSVTEKYAEPWMSISLERLKSSWDYLSQPNTKKIKVKTNGLISESDLSDRLNAIFGSGSTSQIVADLTSQVLGYNNSTDIRAKVSPLVSLAIFAGIAGIIYWVARESRYWQDAQPLQNPQK